MTPPRNIAELPLLLRAKDAALILGVTPWTIYDMIKAGKLRSVGKVRKQHVLRTADVLAAGGFEG